MKKYSWFPYNEKYGLFPHVVSIPKMTDPPNDPDGNYIMHGLSWTQISFFSKYESDYSRKIVDDFTFTPNKILKLKLEFSFIGSRAYSFMFFKEVGTERLFPMMNQELTECISKMKDGKLEGYFAFIRRYTYYYGIKMVENPEEFLMKGGF